MILVTGGTGFIGSRLVRKLIQSGQSVRILLRPKRKTPNLPRKTPLDVAVSSFEDERGLRAALRDVDTIFHLATAEHQEDDATLEIVDVQGTTNLITAAGYAGVKRLLYLGRIGADKSSSYPVLRAKALAEDQVRKSQISFCVLKLTDIFGNRDYFTNEIASAIRRASFFFLMPGDGKMLVQPLWIEDLISVLMLIYEQKRFRNEIIEIGGGEFFEYGRAVRIVMSQIGKRKPILPLAPAYLRIINLWFRRPWADFPLSTRWLDLLAMDRTCPLDSMARNFSILPARFESHLDFLHS